MDRKTTDWIDEAIRKCKSADDIGSQIIILRYKSEDTTIVVSNLHDEDDVPFLRAMTAALNEMPLDQPRSEE